MRSGPHGARFRADFYNRDQFIGSNTTQPPLKAANNVTNTSASPSSTVDFKSVVGPELTAIDAVITRHLTSDVALVNQIGHYIVGAGGKRVRPVLVTLVAKALGFDGPQRHELAAVVEFIHTATLLHDDVVDESALRRGRDTANALFGNAASVLVGDFLYSRAFQMMVSVNRMRILEVLANATNVIAEGEVLQLMNMHDPDLTVDDYYRVIQYKTAQLFEASARLGAILAEAEPEVEDACARFGVALGTAFQLVDDLLDYEGTTVELGKNVGDDLREGKSTLPLIIAMQRSADSDRQTLRRMIERGTSAQELDGQLDEALQIVRNTGALEATRNAAREQVLIAQNCLKLIPHSRYREALLELSAQSVNRIS